jgi:hypothetical protein
MSTLVKTLTAGLHIDRPRNGLFTAEGVVRSGRLFLLEMTDQGGSLGQLMAALTPQRSGNSSTNSVPSNRSEP